MTGDERSDDAAARTRGPRLPFVPRPARARADEHRDRQRQAPACRARPRVPFVPHKRQGSQGHAS
ncbi:hypothetical protein GCM10023113_14110 [Cellulomonas oligotrophica]|uniref:Uncharacterized protein n=1 Tax=Cellulomonas oligotrophica TaxID=931536 RepID=A0ABQ4DDC1_9CELL|nr:hypothetical protein Col01nite_28900 [Cellulomonas oligotrophica]